MGDPQLRLANASDVDALVDLMSAFNSSQGYRFDAAAGRRNLADFLATPSSGRIWLVLSEGRALGYLVLAFGFSFEYGGRDAFIDEFFLDASVRGRGWGKRALESVLREARALGVNAVHLEVEAENEPARGLYERSGFGGSGRSLLTARLPAADREAAGWVATDREHTA